MARHLHLKKKKEKQQLMGTATIIWATAKIKTAINLCKTVQLAETILKN